MKGYRTVIFNAIVALFAVASAVLPDSNIPQGPALEALFSLGWEALVALLALGNIFLRGVTDTPMFTSGDPPESKASSSLLVGIGTLLLAMSIFLPGCSSIRDNPGSAQLVTQYAVAKYLEDKKTDQARYDAAVRIVKIASDLKSVTSGNEVRLEGLRLHVQGALAAQPLSPADRILANGLAEMLLKEIEARFYRPDQGGANDPAGPPGVLSRWQLVVVNDVLGWVIGVAMAVPNPAVERPT